MIERRFMLVMLCDGECSDQDADPYESSFGISFFDFSDDMISQARRDGWLVRDVRSNAYAICPECQKKGYTL